MNLFVSKFLNLEQRFRMVLSNLVETTRGCHPRLVTSFNKLSVDHGMANEAFT
jgi:hypothetical protein